jgi:hypothetical protein
MNVQFDWWLLIVGFVIGAGLTGLVLAELRRREDDVTEREREAEAAWIAADMTVHGIPADPDAVGEVLRLHRLYLASIPADDTELAEVDEVDVGPVERQAATGADPPDRADVIERETSGSPAGQAPDAREDARTVS